MELCCATKRPFTIFGVTHIGTFRSFWWLLLRLKSDTEWVNKRKKNDSCVGISGGFWLFVVRSKERFVLFKNTICCVFREPIPWHELFYIMKFLKERLRVRANFIGTKYQRSYPCNFCEPRFKAVKVNKLSCVSWQARDHRWTNQPIKHEDDQRYSYKTGRTAKLWCAADTIGLNQRHTC